MPSGEALLELITAISTSQQVEEIAELVLDKFCDLFNVEACAIFRWNGEDDFLNLWAGDLRGVSKGTQKGLGQLDLNQLPLAHQALTTGQPVQWHINKPGVKANDLDLSRVLKAKSLLWLPLTGLRRIYGLILLEESRLIRTFDEIEVAQASHLAKFISQALEKTWLIKDLQERSAELEAVRRASLSLTASLDLQQVLDTILENTLGLLNEAQDAHIFLYQDDRLSFGAALWSDGRKGQPWSHPRENGLTYNVARKGEMIVVPDMRTHPLFSDTPISWQGSIIGIPLRMGNRIVGVMTVAYAQPKEFSEVTIRILRHLGDQAAIAIENARLHILVSRQARTDVLSGLPNRRALDERLEDEINRARRYEYPLALMMIDLNGFKRVNDYFGHPIGDRVLQQIANCMRRSVRDSDFLARYGGDEFALLLPKTDTQTAKILARRLQAIVASNPIDVPGNEGTTVTISYGIAAFPKDGNSAGEVLASADRSLYNSKDNHIK